MKIRLKFLGQSWSKHCRSRWSRFLKWFLDTSWRDVSPRRWKLQLSTSFDFQKGQIQKLSAASQVTTCKFILVVRNMCFFSNFSVFSYEDQFHLFFLCVFFDGQHLHIRWFTTGQIVLLMFIGVSWKFHLEFKSWSCWIFIILSDEGFLSNNIMEGISYFILLETELFCGPSLAWEKQDLNLW